MFRKHILYLTNQNLQAFVWRGGKVLSTESFLVGDQGLEAFARYLAGKAKLRTYLIVDLIEQDFRVDTIPHAGPRDRRPLLERKLAQTYRATPYRYGVVQARESTGRRDDKVLYTAITNSELLSPWVDLLQSFRIPLEGIYSAPVLSRSLLQVFKITAKHVLLVTQEEDAGVRQSYFQDGKIRFSRLSSFADLRSDEFPRFIEAEVRKTWQYLEALHNFEAGEVLYACLFVHPQATTGLPLGATELQGLQFAHLLTTDCAKRIRLTPIPPNSNAKPFFVQWLGSQAPGNHFAQPQQTRLARMWRIRNALVAGSLLVGAVGAAAGALNLLDARELRLDLTQKQLQMQSIESESRMIVARLPRDVVNPQSMMNTVQFYRTVIEEAPDLYQTLLKISHVLDEFPSIGLTYLNWRATLDPATLPAYVPTFQNAKSPISSVPAAPSTPTSMAPPVITISTGGRDYAQFLALEGQVAPFDQNYRGALREVQSLVEALRKLPSVTVTPMVLPIDPSPNMILRGKAASELEKGEARFALKLEIAAKGK